ncbi:hypothetical protein HAP94_15995 [Acidithiobacillus ferrivorans]|nr:hypothetical protein [Acidithiobacillus ferrivorans]
MTTLHMVSVSGGKDSTATLLLALDKVPRNQIMAIRFSLRTALVGAVILSLSGCLHRSSNEAVHANVVRKASPCVHQIMVDYAKTKGELLTYKQYRHAKYSCRMLAKVQRKMREYPANSCVDKAAIQILHATSEQRIAWVGMPFDQCDIANSYCTYGNGVGIKYPSLHQLLSWSSIKQSCRRKANTKAQIVVLAALRSAA